MRPSLHTKFLEKAQAAVTSAVEVYNKPSFAYREETFALLALNSWELLLKAKLLKDGENDLKVIRVYEPRKTKKGAQSKKLYLKRNRAGNPHTISLGSCITELDKTPAKLTNEIKANLSALIAIRDNSAHYISASTVLAKQVLEIASASVKNFVILAKKWHPIMRKLTIRHDGHDAVSALFGDGHMLVPAEAWPGRRTKISQVINLSAFLVFAYCAMFTLLQNR